MNASFLIASFLLILILIINGVIPKIYRQPFQRLLLVLVIMIALLSAIFPNYIALPLANIFNIKRSSDFILYLLTIFIIAILNSLYREIRELNKKLNKIMQMNTIYEYFKEKKINKKI